MNEHKNIITIEDEIKEFSDKPVKSSALYKKVKELESNAVPDSSEASVGDVLTKGEDGIGWSAPSGGGGLVLTGTWEYYSSDHVSVYVLEKTNAELSAAITAGQPITVVVTEYTPDNDPSKKIPAFVTTVNSLLIRDHVDFTQYIYGLGYNALSPANMERIHSVMEGAIEDGEDFPPSLQVDDPSGGADT